LKGNILYVLKLVLDKSTGISTTGLNKTGLNTPIVNTASAQLISRT